MVTVYIAYFLLDTQTDFYRDNGRVREDAAVIFHLVCLLLPALYGLFGAWQERTHLAQTCWRASPCCLPSAAWPWPWNKASAGAAGLVGGDPLAVAAWPVDEPDPDGLPGVLRGVCPAGRAILQASLALACGAADRPGRYLLDAAQDRSSRPSTLNIMCSQVMLMIAAAASHEAYQMAFRDELTGLPGRRALNERMQRLGRNYVIAMTDVDHFKKFNDTHGHDVGDQVLRLVASRLSKVTGGGRAHRYGGEEFALRVCRQDR